MTEKNPSLQEKTFSIPVVTSGLTHGIGITGFLFIDPDDKIIVADHHWENYSLILNNWFGGVLERFSLFKSSGFNIEDFKDKIRRSSGKTAIYTRK